MTPDARKLHAIERWTLGLGAVVTIATFLCFGRELGLAVSIGAGLMALNAIAMRRVGEKIWTLMKSDAGADNQASASRSRPSVVRAVVLFNLKMLAVLVAVYLIVRELHVNPIGLVIGLSVYPLAAVAVALTWTPPASTPTEDQHG